MRNVMLMAAGGLGAIMLGVLYICRVFGPVEAEVVLWGQVSLYMGIVLIAFSLAAGYKRMRIFTFILGLGYFLVMVLQLPPIVLWFAFHGFGISDGTPPSSFVAHWGYAIPHIILFLLSAFTLYHIARGTTLGLRGRK